MKTNPEQLKELPDQTRHLILPIHEGQICVKDWPCITEALREATNNMTPEQLVKDYGFKHCIVNGRDYLYMYDPVWDAINSPDNVPRGEPELKPFCGANCAIRFDDPSKFFPEKDK